MKRNFQKCLACCCLKHGLGSVLNRRRENEIKEMLREQKNCLLKLIKDPTAALQETAVPLQHEK